MNTRQEWLNTDNISSQFYSAEETISNVKENFDIRRNYSAEGSNVIVDGIECRALVQYFSNPLNQAKYDKELHVPMEINIHTGSLIEYEGFDWLITGNVDDLQAYKSAGMVKCNNTLKFYNKNQNHILYNIPCIIIDKITTDLQENKFLLTIDCDILVMIANNEINNLISPNDIFKIGRYSYYITKPDDVTKPGLIILPMKFTEEMQEEHLYTLEILNGNSVDVQISTELQLNINVYDNGTLISPLPSLIFTSSNELIADVSENGLVNIYDIVDNCNITVSLESDNSVFDIININVIENVQNNITYSLTSESLPDNEIILTQTKVYEVNKYNNGNLVEQTFTFSIIGDLSAYQLVVLDGNSCSVKALKSGSVIILKAIDDSNGEIVLKDIRLKNLF